MWSKAENLGEQVTFLLETGGDAPADPFQFLDGLLGHLREVSLKGCIYEAACQVYKPLLVYVSILDDPSAEPTDVEDQNEVGIDEWFPLHLAIVLRKEDVVSAIVEFHQLYGRTVLESVLCGRKVAVPCECCDHVVKPSPISPSACDLKSNDKRLRTGSSVEIQQPPRQQCVQYPNSICQVRREFGRALLVFGEDAVEGVVRDGWNSGDSDCANRSAVGGAELGLVEGAVEWPFDSSYVTGALRPLFLRLVWERSRNRVCGLGDELRFSSEENFVERIVRSRGANDRGDSQMLPDMLVDSTVMYDACEADIAVLLDILELFGGLLQPVLVCHRLHPDCTSGCVSASYTDMAYDSDAGGDHGYIGEKGERSNDTKLTLWPPFLISYPVQEHQKIAFLLMWLNFRRVTLLVHGPGPHSTVKVVHPSPRQCDVSTTITSMGQLHSLRLFVLLQLASPEVAIQDFLAVAQSTGDVLSANVAPLVFVAALIAGAIASSLPSKSYVLQTLCGKLKALQTCVPGGVLALRQYIASSIDNEAERFRELWLAATPFTLLKKFNSRAEMLYFGLVELVLLGAERMWASPQAFMSTEYRASAVGALGEWFAMCRDFFCGLAGFEDDTPLDLGRDMEQRLKCGRPPCFELYVLLYSQERSVSGHSGVSRTSDCDPCALGNDAAGDGLEAVFAAAQQTFTSLVNTVAADVKLELYALYKQATEGDVNISRPWITDMVGRAKWDAWSKVKGMSSDAAKRQYASRVTALTKT